MNTSDFNSAGIWAKKFHLAARSAIEKTLRPFDLGATQWFVLRHLFYDGPLAQSDLLKLLQVEKPTLSGVVAALVRKGFVQQTTSPEDQRRKLLSMTPAGHAVWEQLLDPIELMRNVAFNNVPKDDLETVVRVLSTGTERLNDYLRNGKTS